MYVTMNESGSTGQSSGGCGLADGRTIPLGEEFDYVQQGKALRCTCPHDAPSSGQVKVHCRRKAAGDMGSEGKSCFLLC